MTEGRRSIAAQVVRGAPAGVAGGERAAFGDVRWLARGGAPSAELSMAVATLVPGGANEEHRHPDCEELLYVLSGEIEHTLGRECVTLHAGDLIVVPRGERHLMRNVSRDEARALIVFSSTDRVFEPVRAEA